MGRCRFAGFALTYGIAGEAERLEHIHSFLLATSERVEEKRERHTRTEKQTQAWQAIHAPI
jgi:hypothetical protein